MRRAATFAIVAIAFATSAACFTAPAFAYDETNSGRTCIECHGTDPVGTSRSGPHGGYTTGTQKCQTCHAIHNANPNGRLLLPGATINETCNTCHDGTSGSGVYGVLAARGKLPESAHSIETTSLIPRGNPDGTPRRVDFSGDAVEGEPDYGTMTCTDCHSPHDNQTVAPFIGDRDRGVASSSTASDPASSTPSDRLLRKKPSGAATETANYGSDWCAGCHQGRMDSPSMAYPHSTETETSTANYFHYGRVARVTALDTTSTEIGPLGQSNFGYVMPDVDGNVDSGFMGTAEQGSHKPICQQCHEDARNVGDYQTSNPEDQGQISTSNYLGKHEGFRSNPEGEDPNIADPQLYANPQFTLFPHEGVNSGFVIEGSSDDLCLNCHAMP